MCVWDGGGRCVCVWGRGTLKVETSFCVYEYAVSLCVMCQILQHRQSFYRTSLCDVSDSTAETIILPYVCV